MWSYAVGLYAIHVYPSPVVLFHTQAEQLGYIAGWAASLAAIGMRLPDEDLQLVCGLVEGHGQHLRPMHREQLREAFAAWGHQPGLALLEALPAPAA